MISAEIILWSSAWSFLRSSLLRLLSGLTSVGSREHSYSELDASRNSQCVADRYSNSLALLLGDSSRSYRVPYLSSSSSSSVMKSSLSVSSTVCFCFCAKSELHAFVGWLSSAACCCSPGSDGEPAVLSFGGCEVRSRRAFACCCSCVAPASVRRSKISSTRVC